MKLYKIYQNILRGYDVYDSAVVIAESETAAQVMHPGNEDGVWRDIDRHIGADWPTDPRYVKVDLLGEATVVETKQCVVVASFNAG